MKKHIIIAILLLFYSSTLLAQEKWTLRECIDYAVENNIEIKQQSLSVEQSEIDVNTSKMSRLPDLNGSVGQSFNFGRSTNVATNISESRNSINTNFSLNSSTPIFTGFRITNEIKVNQLNLKAAVEGLNKAKENLELQITNYYLDVLFKKELVKITQEQIEQTTEQVERTRLLVEGGKVPLSQLYDIKAQLANDELGYTNAQNNLNLSLLDLSQALNITENKAFDIATPHLENAMSENLSSILPPNEIYEEAIRIKPHIREVEYRLQSDKRNLKVAQSGHWPTLNLNMGYGTAYGRTSGYDNTRFKRQFRDNASQQVGLSLSIPIFSRMQTRNRIRGAKLQISNRTLDLDNVKLAFYKEIQQAFQSAVAAQAKYTSTEKAYLAAKESYKYAQEKYAVGKSTVFEFNEAKLKLTTSQSEQVQSKYDFIFRAKILDFYRGIQIDI